MPVALLPPAPTYVPPPAHQLAVAAGGGRPPWKAPPATHYIGSDYPDEEEEDVDDEDMPISELARREYTPVNVMNNIGVDPAIHAQQMERAHGQMAATAASAAAEVVAATQFAAGMVVNA